MKLQLSIITALLIGSGSAYANEIPGTRVSGQAAVCAADQAKAIETNATTKEVTSYCFTRVAITPPVAIAPAPIFVAAPDPTPAPVFVQNNPSIYDNPKPVITPEIITVNETSTVLAPVKAPAAPIAQEKQTHIEINATTNETTIRQDTEEEWLDRWLWSWFLWYQEFQTWLDTWLKDLP